MARTAVPYSNLAANSALADPAGTAVDITNDHVINSAKPELTVLRVTNTHSSVHVVTVKAGDYPPALASGQGDLAVTIGATTGVQWIGPFESGRFLQSNGTMEIDIEAAHTGNITAFLLPRGT